MKSVATSVVILLAVLVSQPLAAQDAASLECLADVTEGDLKSEVFDDFLERQGRGSIPDELLDRVFTSLEPCVEQYEVAQDKLNPFAQGSFGFLLVNEGKSRLAAFAYDARVLDALIDERGWKTAQDLAQDLQSRSFEEQAALFQMSSQSADSRRSLVLTGKIYLAGRLNFLAGVAKLSEQ